MSSAADQSNFPTMIIPKGTEIKINQQGQLSIKTPGNLVIQNSGIYSELESTNGSIRIEENVHVEAISVRAAQACFIQGTLTAWRVHAKRIALEDRARANIMLQESEQLELSKTSRLVGNFANEKEIYLLMAKFSPQLKQLPSAIDVHSAESPFEATNPALRISPATPPPAQAGEFPEPLRHAQILLENEIRRPDLDPRSAEILRELVFSLREQDQHRVAAVYRDAFAELGTASSEAIRSAYNLIDQHYTSRA
jgi:hypothetical protein